MRLGQTGHKKEANMSKKEPRTKDNKLRNTIELMTAKRMERMCPQPKLIFVY